LFPATEVTPGAGHAFESSGLKRFDVGVDMRTQVDDKDYRVPFPFTGTINKLTIKLGPEQLPSERPVGTTGKKP
jgi:hypothetical protein